MVEVGSMQRINLDRQIIIVTFGGINLLEKNALTFLILQIWTYNAHKLIAIYSAFIVKTPIIPAFRNHVQCSQNSTI